MAEILTAAMNDEGIPGATQPGIADMASTLARSTDNNLLLVMFCPYLSLHTSLSSQAKP